MDYKDPPITKIKPNKFESNRSRNKYSTPLQVKKHNHATHLEETQMATMAYDQQNLEKFVDNSEFSQSNNSSRNDINFYNHNEGIKTKMNVLDIDLRQSHNKLDMTQITNTIVLDHFNTNNSNAQLTE